MGSPSVHDIEPFALEKNSPAVEIISGEMDCALNQLVRNTTALRESKDFFILQLLAGLPRIQHTSYVNSGADAIFNVGQKLPH